MTALKPADYTTALAAFDNQAKRVAGMKLGLAGFYLAFSVRCEK